ncbi:ubiquitin carboxyl-terminal hydrolase 10-B-like [Dendronephthya gigantea]|uniref:ubiquitin carboxyl-terminal hydrolase 10-B-like n=1 Tax=Dendronephthya gigantea TaxID=151771 RepID=UPI001068FFA4|nr:ubiquitin carboxyl-terminal hydrolase 10-B-like [Dendronephthya gigantea]
MENNTIIFGDFTEEDILVYFSDEIVKSSGTEFPEDFHMYILSTTLSGKDCSREALDISNKVEYANINTGLDDKRKLVETFTSEMGRVPNEFMESRIATDVDKVSGNNEVLCSVDESILPDISNSNTSLIDNKQNLNSDDTNIRSENVSNENNGSLLPKAENSLPSLTPTSAESNNSPTNVVTVGTKTMLTTSTRTVESRNEGVKSSWADLFKTKSTSKPQDPLPQVKSKPQQPEQSTEEDSLSKTDQFQQYFSDVLKRTSLTNQVPSLQPRGLKNNGNWCYINSTLQVLLFCPSFYHFLAKFKLKAERGTSLTPILDALVLFVSQFSEMPPQQSTAGRSRDWNKQDVVMGMPFEPIYVYKLLCQVKTSLSQQGKQEDAEEFLSCILNGLHEEMVQLNSAGNKTQPENPITSTVEDQAVGDWEQVGPRNKSTITRKAAMSKSPIAAMFGGYLRSSLLQPGLKESASIQPFFTIPLDLRGEVSTVQQAFDHFFRVEEVEGFQCDKSKTEVEVSKKWTLDTLPIVLVLHLKRFVVNKNGCEKLTKKITYDAQLQVPMETLSKMTKLPTKNMLSYKLFAVTYHHGKNLHGGHYTSDISHPSVGWLRADDMNVRTVPPKFVFNPLSNRDPYLLYYCRGDI